MKDSDLDSLLKIIFLILGLLLVLIPLFRDVKNIIEIKDRKGKFIKTETKGVSTWGKVFIFLFLLAAGAGTYIEIRDKKSKYEAAKKQTELTSNISYLRNESENQKERFDSQQKMTISLYRNDSTVFSKILKSLHKNKLGLDSNLNVVNYNIRNIGSEFSNNTFIGNGIGVLDGYIIQKK
ncbi:MAG: hypothetical protein Q8941_05750 [Bacteroidota bacterium]|nr:hypothetical protein [Bacteroidota bacterium]